MQSKSLRLLIALLVLGVGVIVVPMLVEGGPDPEPDMQSSRAGGQETAGYPSAVAGSRTGEQDRSVTRGIRVTVVGQQGRPVTSYRLQLRRVFDDAELGTCYGECTDSVEVRSAAGVHVLPAVAPGEWATMVETPTLARSYSDRFVVSEEQADLVDVRVVMSVGGRLTGIVTDDAGKPIVGAVIRTQDNNRLDQIPMDMGRLYPPFLTQANAKFQVTTDTDGRFLITRLNPSVYQLRVVHPDHVRTYVQDLHVQEGQLTDAGRIVMELGCRVEGFVTRAEKVLPGAKVMIAMQPTGDRPPARHVLDSVYADEDGHFRCSRALPAGRYTLQATTTDVANPFQMIIQAAESQREVQLSTGVMPTRVDLVIP
ncbi:MAG: carboxypeptidase-like regulatory domain-containing protein [Planctomycetota bacterium]